MSIDSAGVKLWDGVVQHLRLSLTDNQFETWIRPVKPVSASEELMELSVPNSFAKEWLGKRYGEAILDTASTFLGGKRPKLRLVVREPEAPRATDAPAAAPKELPVAVARGTPRDDERAPMPLHREYRFDNFVVGPNNRLAFAAAQNLVEKDAPFSNSMFIHGGVGLGKTHLLHAICHGFSARRPDYRVVHLSCEGFVNRFIAAVDRGEVEGFRSSVRDADVLVVDDVHFLGQKERSQEEFLHTFNHLEARGRHVVLSADAPPGDIPGLTDRLASRFKAGFTCELEPPDFETRLAIVKRKAARIPVAVPEDVAVYVAESIRTNIRELEGALVRVVGFAHLTSSPISLEGARQTLREVVVERKRKITLDHVARAVTEYFSVKLSDLQSKRRPKVIAFPRQVCMFLARRMTRHSLEEIGAYFGGRDHSTVLYSIERTEAKAKTNAAFASLLDVLGVQVQIKAGS